MLSDMEKWGDLVHKSYVGERGWMHNLFDLSNKGYANTKTLKSFMILYAILVIIPIQFPLLISPLIIGGYFLFNWQTQAVGEFKGLQWWIIFVAWMGALLTLFLYIALSDTTSDKRSKG